MTSSIQDLSAQIAELTRALAEKDRTIAELSEQLQRATKEHTNSSSESVLSDQLRFIKTLFDTIPNPVFYKNTEGIYLGCNSSFANLILGIEPDQIIGCSLYDLPEQIPKKLADIYRKQDLALFANPGLQVYETKVKCSDGEIREFIFYKTTYHDTKGEVAGLLGLMLDVTEKNAIQLALKESEEKYRSMMESMTDAVYICSPDNQITYMNPRMIEQIGYDATGGFCYKTIHNLDEPCPWCSFSEICTGAQTETEIKSPRDGKTYLIRNSPIFHQDGSVSKMTIYHDITHRRQMERDLLQARKLEATGVFAGGIAHDYNNLLFIILGNLLLLEQHLPPASPGFSCLEAAEEAAQKSAQLTKRLLVFTHGEPLSLEKVSLAEIFQKILARYNPKKEYPIELSYDQGLPDLWVDTGLLVIALTNIIDNAIDAMPAGGTIQISAYPEMVEEPGVISENSPQNTRKIANIRIDISDKGPGIREDILPQIFDPYVSTKARGTDKGMGFGLATSYSIIKKHNGNLFAHSQLEHGATFTILLPIGTT